MTNNKKGKEERPSEYFAAINNYCYTVDEISPELQKDIKEKNEISIPLRKLAEKMGYEFLASRTADGELAAQEENVLNMVYWKTKFCLFRNGIIVEPKKIDREYFILMRPRESIRNTMRTSLF